MLVIFVFDDKKLDVYLKDEFKVSGKIFTSDERDPRSRLYPITLHRNVEQKTSLNYFKPAFANDDLPSYVEDGPLPAAMLAKSYKRPDLSELDRYHAKFGDVGIKYMKRCMPHLKIPKQYRCDICIDGKIHKFGHKACAEGVRKTYLPGVCIHTDHSGPYAKSLSGARYSQLYLDRGSGYLWACRQKKKTGHYESTPKIFIDSWGLSGRKVQIFQSDGDGVFVSSETREILENEKVRHEWSAPYDSDTNAFIERARRTIFEGVCTLYDNVSIFSLCC